MLLIKTSRGFSKKLRRMNGERTNFWNFSKDNLAALEAFISAYEPVQNTVQEIVKSPAVEVYIPVVQTPELDNRAPRSLYINHVNQRDTATEKSLIDSIPCDILSSRYHINEQKTKTNWC